MLAAHCRKRGLFLSTNNDGRKLTLPAVLTSGSSTSRGPAPLWPSYAPRSRRGPDVRGAPPPSALPSLSAQGVRTLVSAEPTPGTLLQSPLPTGRTPLASLASHATLSRLGPRQTTTPRPESALSPPRTAATRRTASGRDARVRASGRERGSAAGRRGPAPSRICRTKCRPALPASWLLRLLPAITAFTAAAFLFVLLPSGVTTRSPAGRPLPPTAAPRCTSPSVLWTATAVNSACYVVAYCTSQLRGTILSRPPTQREEREGRCPRSPVSFL